MRVESVDRITNRKYRVTLEDGTAFALYSGEVLKFHIEEGAELSSDSFSQIHDEILMKRVKLRCMNLLKDMDRTQAQLTDRLKRDGYSRDLIDAALAYVASYHYTDDARYSLNYVRSHSASRSRKQIEFDLMKKGVCREDIRAAFDICEQEEGELYPPSGQGDRPVIRRLMEKRHFDKNTAGFEETQKLIGYLSRKGFSLRDIRAELSEDE